MVSDVMRMVCMKGVYGTVAYYTLEYGVYERCAWYCSAL
jgi:hypothetical protein